MTDAAECRVDDSADLKLGHDFAGIRTASRWNSTIYVHKDLLARRSESCKQALEKSASDNIDLRDQPFDHIDRYIHHLYTGKIRMSKWTTCFSCDCLGKDPSLDCSSCARTNAQEGYELLIRLLFFSRKLADKTFCNDLFNAFIAHHQEFDILPEARLVKLAYEGTVVRSKLRRLLVDMFHHFSDSLGDDPAIWPARFLLDISNAGLGQGQKQWPLSISCCDYRTHGTDEVCTSKKRKRDDDSEDE